VNSFEVIISQIFIHFGQFVCYNIVACTAVTVRQANIPEPLLGNVLRTKHVAMETI
jgi:hypothetical protein